MVIIEAIYLKTKNPLYLEMAKFWTKVFALTFAFGVATGIVMEFEFGTNWATYSRYVGDVFGKCGFVRDRLGLTVGHDPPVVQRIELRARLDEAVYLAEPAAEAAQRLSSEPARVAGFGDVLSPGFNAALGLESIYGPDAIANPWLREFVEAAQAAGIPRGDYNGRDRGGAAGAGGSNALVLSPQLSASTTCPAASRC